MTDLTKLQQTILDFVRAEYLEEGDDLSIGLDTPLISSGLVDSFSMISLKSFLERQYKIVIPDEKAKTGSFDSVGKIAVVVAELTR